jgi:alpha-beta hydrolase superfamily lysophospholipase
MDNNTRQVSTTQITTADGRQIEICHWVSEKPKAYLHICHGMAEHIGRYEQFAQAMADAGFYVFGHNHRGHGANETLGHYADSDGWLKTINDIKDVEDSVTAQSDLPLFLFAHSMGSFIAQGFAIRYGQRLTGLILSGSNYQHPFTYYAGRLVASIENKRIGLGTPSTTMDKLSFASFNTHFKPNRTEFDWLSRDAAEVDQYIADPLCGFPCSAETWKQLLTGLIEIGQQDQLAQIPNELPIHLLGGDKDPVGRMGKGIPALAKKLEAAGNRHVSVKLYPNARHEMLNETCKQSVYDDVATWINNVLIK